MGTEAVWMPYVAAALSTAGTAASVINTRNVAKKQDNIAAQGIRTQAENQRKTNARVNQTVQQIAKSDPGRERATARSSYLDQIQRSQAQANSGLAARGISAQFDQMAGGAANDALGYAGNVADLMSRIDAGSLSRQRESNVMGDLGMDLDVDRGVVQGDEFLTGLRMRGVRRNPYLDAASGLLSGYATYAGGAKNGSGGAPGGYGVTTVNRGGNMAGYT